nr:TetR/AcrR family transcriptional regulator [Bacteroidota bacterium]
MNAKKKYQFGDLRFRLLKTASEIISKEGLKKLTMRALSNQVGVSRTAPYRHFENKDALLLAIAEEGFNELTIRYQKINRDKSLDSLSRLQNIGLAYVEFAIKNPGAFRLMFGQEIT